MVRGRLDIRPRDDARASTSSPPTADISLRKFQDRAAHIAPVVSSIRRFDYDTELPYVESDLCRDANTKTTRATFVCARRNRDSPRETRRRRQLSNGTRARESASAFAMWPFVIYGRPSDRSGPGCVSTDRNVRSKCRCSNVSCSSHYDAQLTAFFIDPRAKFPYGNLVTTFTLNDQVWSTSQRRRRPIEPPRVGPKTSLNHSIGSSDGRCVQRAGTTKEFQRVARPLGQGEHADSFSVARVRPRTSKGITDLLLLNLVRLEAAGPSKKILITPPVSRATRTPRTPE
ncbi:hypothetical protein EVAR_89992_1 [Eumeta japonica]|uniref:Uncharacterized protein n=1 Tax=Eumeta variegata TaxID=151549 RepID=A0A4C2ACT3_EUMVA|nr:hypothetical protein EVAR_89992_1 [Eumeta japonica]